MLDDTIKKIENKIKSASLIKPQKREDLLKLISVLKTEITELSKTNHEEAQSIASFTEITAHETTKGEKNPRLVELSLQGLSSSVEGFETSHPKLSEIVNTIAELLSNIGI